MEHRKLGANGPDISVVGYGAWEAADEAWGPAVGTDRVARAIHEGLDAGMTWIDTAEAYGRGASERVVGEVVRERRARGEEPLVFTKWAWFISGKRPEDGRRAIRTSLGNLGLDHVDLYQVHWPVPDVPVEEIWGVMGEIRDEGLARWIGVSNFTRPMLERCLAEGHVDSVQNHLSLLRLRDTPELLPWLEEQGVGYLGYAPLGFGLLTGAITEDTTFDEDDWRSGTQDVGYYDEFFAPGKIEPILARVQRLQEVAGRLDAPLATLALRAAIDQRGVTGVIAGSRNPDHARSNASAGDLRLSPGDLEQIRAIFDA